MGERGPVPKRSSERRRRNKENGPISTGTANPDTQPLTPDDDWHPIARQWFDSLAESGQAEYYEPSDWATAYYVAEVMSRNLRNTAKFSAMLFSSVMSAMTELLTTEGSRRRVRLELEHGDTTDQDELASVTALSTYKRTLGVVA